MATVTEENGVRYIDDSKATNPPAAAASLAAFDSVVWVAGGLLKGADVTDLVKTNAGRLRGVVLMGRDRNQFREVLAAHAPDVPVVEIEDTDGAVAMDRAVHEARGMARPGDTVLLAPAAASLDMFSSYGARGDAFAERVLGSGGASE